MSDEQSFTPPLLTGPDGRFRIRGLVPGVSYTVAVIRKGAKDYEHRYEGNVHGDLWTLKPGDVQRLGRRSSREMTVLLSIILSFLLTTPLQGTVPTCSNRASQQFFDLLGLCELLNSLRDWAFPFRLPASSQRREGA